MPTLTRQSIQDVALIFILAAMGAGGLMAMIVTGISTGRISWMASRILRVNVVQHPRHATNRKRMADRR